MSDSLVSGSASKYRQAGALLSSLKKRQVHCDRPTWEDLARLLAFRLEEDKHVEFVGIWETVEFEDGDTQSLGPYAGFQSKQTFPNGRRAQVRVPFDAELLRDNPSQAVEIANAARVGMEELYENRPSGNIR